MKRLLLFILPPLMPFFSYAMEIEQKNLFVPKALGKLSVVKADNHFTIVKNGKSFSVEPDRLDSALRKLDKKKLVAFLKTGYLSVNKSKDGSYSLQSHSRIRGGGIFGAMIGAFLGKGLVSVVGHGSIYLIGLGVSTVATPAVGIPVSMFLTGTCAPMIEMLSIKAAIAGGIMGGVTTGPV